MDIGAQLREAREAHGLSLTRLAQRTRVPEKTLAAIERNDRSALPPHPFSRGFVRTYATEVDLDPDRLARDYFAQFPEQPPAEVPALRSEIPQEAWQSHSPWMGLATAFAILVVVVATAVLLGRRGERLGDAQPAAVGTTGEASASPSAPPSTASTPTTADRSAPAAPVVQVATPSAAPQANIVITLAASRPCWVTAKVNGQRTIYRTLQAGERETLTGEKEVRVLFGDAGAITWTINGRDPGPPGANGAVREIRVTPENAATVK